MVAIRLATAVLAAEDWQMGPFVKVDDANPCLTPNANAVFRCPMSGEVRWEEKDVFNPAAVVRDERVHLVYRAENKPGQLAKTSRLGLAWSEDGLHFTRRETPILFPDNDGMKQYEWPGGVEDPRIVENEEGQYVMTYTAYDGKVARLAIATSKDLVHWEKRGLAFGGKYQDEWTKSAAIVCRQDGEHIVSTKVGGKYWMYLRDSKLLAATSDDLIHWKILEDEQGKPRVIFCGRKGYFDSELVEPGPPPLLRHDGIWSIYNGVNAKEGGDAVLAPGTFSGGQILFDVQDPTRVLQRSEKCFIQPDRPYEQTGQVANVCFLEGMVFFKGSWFLYYGTADSKIAVAVCGQYLIAAVERMPRLPEPLNIRDWPTIARDYYALVLNPDTVVGGHHLAAVKPGEPGFRMPSFVGPKLADEAMTCLSAVVGARLAGLDPRGLNGVDWVQAAKAWYSPKLGIYRHNRGDNNPVVHADIYGYWAAIQGMILAAQYPDDADLQKQLRTSVAAFLKIAHGMGCPDQPNFDVLGFNFDTGKPDGRNEPMNRLGHAPSVAWPLVVGASLDTKPDPDLIACARAALRWHIEHPGRYEVSHVMGPLAAARLNAEFGGDLDLGRIMAIWFGAGDRKRHSWHVTAGTRFGGMTSDGLDAAKWDEKDHSFHAFAMGTLQGPAWLVPVARYDQRYARAIARYALHAANSSRLFQGVDLDWDHQDHKDWKDRWDPKNLLFYEAVTSWDWSDTRTFRPYATGDPVRLGWGCPKAEPKVYYAKKKEWFSKSCNNLSLYMGNHVGFLGGIVSLTDVPGVLRWDCLATDWFHAPAYPTCLYYNPFDAPKTVNVTLAGPADLYDLVVGEFVARNAANTHRLTLAPDQAVVIVVAPVNGKAERKGKMLMINGTTVDYNAPPTGRP
ncbi:MAG: glycoside hydrolase family 130 protein [Planctomycetota bacterium]|nr:glycoside hydrolase family 130 protein [Planctomycetota bacterium]